MWFGKSIEFLFRFIFAFCLSTGTVHSWRNGNLKPWKCYVFQFQAKIISQFLIAQIDNCFFFLLPSFFRLHFILYLFLTGHTCTTTQPLLHPFKYRQRKNSLLAKHYRTDRSNRKSVTAMATANTIAPSIDSPSNPKFQFKKALIVTKLSRYEFEQHKNPKLTVVQLEKVLRDRGTDYDLWLHYHRIHKEFERKVADSFRDHGIDVKLVNR